MTDNEINSTARTVAAGKSIGGSLTDKQIAEIAEKYSVFACAGQYDICHYECEEDFYNCVRACLLTARTAADAPAERTFTHPDGSTSTYISNYENDLETDLAAIRDLFPIPESGELHNLWAEACSEARCVVAYAKAQYEGLAPTAPVPQAASTASAVPEGWKLVPVEPTMEMIEAVFADTMEDQSVQGQQRRRAGVAATYRKMIAVAAKGETA